MEKVMKASEVQALLHKVDSLNKKQDEWICALPSEIRPAFYDNAYTEASSLQISELLTFIFGDWIDDVSYFLYESAPHKIKTSKGDYVINNVKEYVDYMVCEGFAIEDRD